MDRKITKLFKLDPLKPNFNS